MRPSAIPVHRLLPTGVAAAVAFAALAVPSAASAAPLYDWTPVGPSQPDGWDAVTSDTDGSVLLASGRGGAVVLSVDSGATWTPITGLALAPTNAVRAVASDADGSVLAVAGENDQLRLSTDGGATWSAVGSGTASTYWTSVAIDGDGSVVLAGSYDRSGLRLTVDAGATWTRIDTPAVGWTDVDADLDGSTLVASGLGSSPYDGQIWRSDDSGTTWTRLTAAPAATWTGIAVSKDGTTLVAVSEVNPNGPGRVAQSTDGGATWHDLPAGGSGYLDAALSADGATVVVAGDGVRVSRDGGASWTLQPDAPANGSGVATSADGTRILSASALDGRLVQGVARPVVVPLAPPRFTTEPQAASGPVGSTVRLTTGVSGNPAPRVHWQRSVDGGSTWTDVPGATTTVLDVAVADPSIQESYRAVAQNSLSYRTSAVVGVTALSAPVPAAAPTAHIAPRFAVGARLAAGLDAALHGSELAPGSTWTVDLFSTPTRIASGTVTGGGGLVETVRIPARTPAGAHRLLLTGTGTNGAPVTSQAWFALDAAGVVTAVSTTGPVPAPATTDGPGTAGLARTGADLPLAGLTGLAALLLAGAGVTLVAARRRRGT